jgi:hypothetical protein
MKWKFTPESVLKDIKRGLYAGYAENLNSHEYEMEIDGKQAKLTVNGQVFVITIRKEKE